ncbi:lipopolysaccharide export system permease protein [Balneicella halophila]|uniref:Lipopolysaccharide export system permease protein n=1 Tax=Balneicella halophila TaxID=1537566 RepID=A0A7L4URW9_BALHA|nr:LptF/LptG family permease [Balneicella halophila]PVX52171.1 lipopolysaccharide export system permease protein [Balneicella halophila]
MKRLHLYIIKSFTGPFLFTLFISVFVLLMASIWRYVDNLAGRDLPISVLIEFFGYYSITTLFMAIPLAILLASIMTLGNLGERYELIAMKAAGISLFRILQPLIIVVVFLSFLTFYISNYIVPISMFKSKTLLSDMVDKNPEFLLKEGTFISDMPGATIKVEGVSKDEAGLFYDAIIYERAPSGRIARTITAQSGKMLASKDMSFMTIWLYKGRMYEEDNQSKGVPFTRTSFDEYMVITPMESSDLERTEKEVNKQDYRMLTYQQLDTLISKTKTQRQDEYARTYNHLSDYRFFKKLPKDSVEIAKVNNAVNVDSIVEALPSSEKAIIFSSALGEAKSMQSYLLSKEESYSQYQTYIAKAEEYWHQKFSWPFACIIFFLVGASLGAIVRQGGFGMPVLISIVLFISYYMITKYGANYFVSRGYLPAYIGNWIATVLFLILGIWLMIKAATDSALMDSDVYEKFIKKIFRGRLPKQISRFIPFTRDRID